MKRLLYLLLPALFQRTSRCCYCKHVIRDRGPLAGKEESHGICDACQSNPARRAHFQPKLVGVVTELKDFARPGILNQEPRNPGNVNGFIPPHGFMVSRFHTVV